MLCVIDDGMIMLEKIFIMAAIIFGDYHECWIIIFNLFMVKLIIVVNQKIAIIGCWVEIVFSTSV